MDITAVWLGGNAAILPPPADQLYPVLSGLHTGADIRQPYLWRKPAQVSALVYRR